MQYKNVLSVWYVCAKQKKQFLAISGEISTIIEFFGIFLRLFLPK